VKAACSGFIVVLQSCWGRVSQIVNGKAEKHADFMLQHIASADTTSRARGVEICCKG
jgi:hypothetical protein